MYKTITADNKRGLLFPFHTDNHQYSPILEYKLIFIRKQQENLEVKVSDLAQLETEGRARNVYL